MRERNLSSYGDVQVVTRSKYDAEDNSLIDSWTSERQDSSVSTMLDVVTPNYHRKSAEGIIINNPMSQSTVTITHTPSVMDAAVTGSYYYTGSWFPELPDYVSYNHDSVAEQNLAVTKAWANVSASKADSLVSLAEGKKTIDGLVDILRRLRKVIRAVKKLRFQELRRELHPDELVQRWLEIRYGLRPLVYDAKNIVDAIKHTFLVKGSRQTFRGVQLYADTVTDTVTSTYSGAYKNDLIRTSTITVEARAGVLCQLERLSNTDVWGLYDVPQAVLDLTTFSFVVDWFFNLSDFVASWTPSASYRTLSSWVMMRVVTDKSVVVGPQTWNLTGWTGGITGGGIHQMHYDNERIVDPTRRLSPKFIVNLDAYKLIDLVALVRSSMTSIRKLRI